MRRTSLLVPAVAGAALVLVPTTAQAARPTTTDLSVTAYDAASVVSQGAVSFTGLTTGSAPYDGPSSTEVVALDGTLPPANTCEPGSATVTVSSTGDAAALTITSQGELCTSFYGNAHTFFGAFTTRDVTSGDDSRLRVVRQGTVSASVGAILPGSGQLAVSATLAR